MANFTFMKYTFDNTAHSTNKTPTTTSFTCLKDSTVIVTVLGTQYQASGNVKLNDTVLFSYDSSIYDPKFMKYVDVKVGDVITFTLDGSGAGYRMYGCILHDDGVF